MAARLSGLILLLLAAVAGRAPAQVVDSSPFTRVITAETLRKAGVVRLAELLRLVDDWDATTQDEFVWSVTPTGGAPPGTPRWLVLVDGQRMELDLLGVASLARLPVPLETIERVDVVRTAALAAGELATAGVIHVHTREPRPGVSAAGWATTGSEIGDPGPFAFTPLATPNVDRIGNDASGRLAYRGNRWFVDAGLQVGKHNSTDPAIADRYLAASREEGRARSTVLAPVARLGIRLPASRHTLSLRHSRAREFLPLEPVAGELAVTERYSHLGLDGTVDVDGSKSLRYYAAWTNNRAEERRAALPTAFAWQAVTLTAGAEATTPVRSAKVIVGARARHVRADAAQPIDRDRLTIGSLYGELVLDPARVGGFAVSAELSTSEGEVGVATAVRNRWRTGRHTTIDVSASYARPVHASDNSIWAWTDRGYSLLRETGVAAAISGPVSRPSRLALDLGATAALTAWSRIRLEGFWRRHDDLTLMERTLGFNPVDASFSGPADVVTDAEGQVAGGFVTAEARGDRLTVRIGYAHQRPIAGDARFRSGQATLPRHKLRSTIEVTPAAGLEVWSLLEYRSATSWREFEPVEAQTGGLYRSRVPASVGLDVAIQKWLWKRRLRTHLGFKNVFGSTIRYHPAGATAGPRMYVQFEARAP
jgi:hypothetical protein